ncbi:MAG: dihydroorotase [Chloroflexi bacterium]|nr:dihydroorotase [Chloroflexota bacterium]
MSQNRPLFIKGGRVIDPSQGLDGQGSVLVRDGKVAWAGLGEAGTPVPSDARILDARGKIVCPGFIDLHCHLREPGFEDKETIATGTRAAAKGGFTTVCCMPNTNPSIDSRGIVELIQEKSRNEGVVRVLPVGCISKGRRGEELAEMGELAEAGAVGFSDDGDPVISSRLMRHAMEYSLTFGLPIMDHCEDPGLAEGACMNEGWVAARLGLKGIPAAAEEVMVARDIALAELTGARLHICHVSTSGSVELIRRAREKGLAVTAEVTPNHLTLTEEMVMGGQGKADARPVMLYDTNAKVNPPLRTLADVRALRRALKEGVIDAIATDHAPHTIVDKLCEFESAAFGISTLETALGSVMALVESGDLDFTTLISKLTAEPARIISKKDGSTTLPSYQGLGTLTVGAPADITIFDPSVEWLVDPASFLSKGKNTPLAGSVLKGRVAATIVGGVVVYEWGRDDADG